MGYKKHLLRFLNLWPPFLCNGIKIVEKSPDYRHMIVKLKLRFWNANYVGTQFGGLLFTLTDPFYMVMLLQNLGEDIIVWDKAATIEYLKPGRSDVTAEFTLTEEDIQFIKQTLDAQEKMLWNRRIEIKDAENTVIATVDKVIYIRKKDKPLVSSK